MVKMAARGTVLFPEPDHSPEISKAREIEAVRTSVRLRGIVDFPEEPVTVDTQETGTERPTVLDYTVDPAHACDQPSHQRWAVEKFGRDREYHLCPGHGVLARRHASELRR